MFGAEHCGAPGDNGLEKPSIEQSPETPVKAEAEAGATTQIDKARAAPEPPPEEENDLPAHVYSTITTAQAGAFLHYHPVVVQHMCAAGTIYAKRIGRKWVIPAQRFLADFQAGKLKPDFRRGEVKAAQKTSIRTATGKAIESKKKPDRPVPAKTDKAEESPAAGEPKEERPKAPAKPQDDEGFFGLPTLTDRDLDLTRW